MSVINEDGNSRVNTILRTEYIIENNDINESKVKDVFNTKDGREYEVMISYTRRK